ncbi:MAG: transketolase [Nakamurella sp.]
MTQTLDRTARVTALAEAADRIRHHILNMGEVQGQGYVGQGLGFADVLAVVYKDLATYRPHDPHWVDRDRVLLSMGHYAIALYAALAEAGTLPVAELETYGSDDSRLPMSGMSTYTPGMEISGGSLGHGLGLGVGMALGLRLQGKNCRVINLMSDGELDEGSTWEAAMAAAHHGLGHLLCVIDMNGLQADGPTKGVLRTEPVQEKWEAFGWRTVRVDGNDISALVAAFDSVPADDDRPAVVICDTRVGSGVPFLETREKAHFMRIDESEWAVARTALITAAQQNAATPEGN